LVLFGSLLLPARKWQALQPVFVVVQALWRSSAIKYHARTIYTKWNVVETWGNTEQVCLTGRGCTA
jgi:hypothetical protein